MRQSNLTIDGPTSATQTLLITDDVVAPSAVLRSSAVTAQSYSTALASVSAATASAAPPVASGALPPTLNTAALGSNGIKLTGAGQGDETGRVVSSVGDVNGDGFKDFLVSASFADPNGTDSGSVYLVYGKAGLTSFNLSAITAAAGNSAGVRFDGGAAQQHLGSFVQGLGDINHDGYADFAMSTSDPSGVQTVYVLFGKSGTTLSGGTLNSSIAIADGFAITSGGAASAIGPVSGIGDINGDGYADYAVGAPGDGGTGAVYVLYGKPTSGLHTINLAALSPSDGYKVSGISTGANFGADLAAAGDVNKDGYADFIVGAPGENTGTGAAYVLFGSASPGPVTLASLSASQGFRIAGASGFSYAGTSVSSAGDINGDGFSDVVVGAPDGYGGTGHAYVVFGKASGIGPVNLANLSAAQGVVITGSGTAGAGTDVAAAGDVNGDGFSDLLVSESSYSSSAVYLIYGKSNIGGQVNLASFGASDGVKIAVDPSNGGYGARSIAGLGDVNGDGGFDLLIGAEQDGVNSTGAAFVVYGPRVNVAPTATNLSQTLTYAPDTTAPLGDIVITDPDSSVVTATLTLSSAAAGALTTTSSGAATSTYNGGTGVWTASGSVIDVNALLAAVAFVPALHYAANLTIATRISDGVATPIGGTIALTGAADQPPVAVADVATTAENASVTIAVLGNDTDIDGGPKVVASVNGVTLLSGQSTTIASGAIVTLNADGTLGYNPNGKFDYLPSAAVAAATGAVGSAVDNFSYTLNGGSSATVAVTVTGVASSGTIDHLLGTTGNDTLTGLNTPNYFDLSQGGNDTATGGSAADSFFLGAAFTAADSINGGAGSDQLGLQGDYTGANRLVFGPTTLTNVETIALLGAYSYDITTNDATVAPGQVLSVYGSELGAGNSLTFNGSAETNGRIVVYGGLGADNITTGSGNDGIYFGRDGRFDPTTDHVDGGAGTDQLALDGSYAVTISGQQVANIETLALLDGTPAMPALYNITLADDWATGSQTKTIYFADLRVGATVDGSAETSARFVFYGGKGDDVIKGGAGNDLIYGGAGADILNGGGGADTFAYTAVSNSIGTSYDTIIGFDPSIDKIDLPFTVTGIDAAKTGNASASTFDNDLTSALSSLGVNHAVQFTVSGGDLAGQIFEVIDANGVAGYQPGQDMVIKLQAPIAPIITPTPFI